MRPGTSSPRIVVLKSDLLYGQLICRWIQEYWRKAEVEAFQIGLDALASIQDRTPDLFVAGARIDDMDGFEHLEPFVETDLSILILTSRTDDRTIALMREIRYNGIYDGHAEGLGNLHTAVERVLGHQSYVSPTFAPRLVKPKNIMLDALTSREQIVLSMIGDGSDNQEAGLRLRMSPQTVKTHRRAIMNKLGLHQKGELMTYAVQKGYVHITPNKVYYPGFQRMIESLSGSKGSAVCA